MVNNPYNYIYEKYYPYLHPNPIVNTNGNYLKLSFKFFECFELSVTETEGKTEERGGGQHAIW